MKINIVEIVKTIIIWAISFAVGVCIGRVLFGTKADNYHKPYTCSHEYSYFKSDEALVITQVPALNECEE